MSDVKRGTLQVKRNDLISDDWLEQNRRLHASGSKFGQRGHRHLPLVETLMQRYRCSTALDYGCGKAMLSKVAKFAVWNYDPAIPEYADDPDPCDFLVCTDVLEHIERDRLENVLIHMYSKMKVAGLLVINTRSDRSKLMPDGRNPHLIVEGESWWLGQLDKVFKVERHWMQSHHLYVICKP